MIGAIIGDIVGSRFEFNNLRSKEFEFFASTCEFTDDSILTVAVAEWLLSLKDGDSLDLGQTIRKWANKYDSSYGGMFRQWLNDSTMGPYNSYGNGSAMRVSPVGFYFDNLSDVLKYAKLSAEVTHNHPEGIKGAQSIAEAIYHLRNGKSKQEVKEIIENQYNYTFKDTCDEIREYNWFDETCQVTVPQSFQCFFESEDFEDAIRLAISIGGDSDTIAAMVGALAEAHYGVPEEYRNIALNYLPDDMKLVVEDFYSNY
jgi:ADP-ribosyl-[dinitrogen reductase] hydrolase